MFPLRLTVILILSPRISLCSIHWFDSFVCVKRRSVNCQHLHYFFMHASLGPSFCIFFPWILLFLFFVHFPFYFVMHSPLSERSEIWQTFPPRRPSSPIFLFPSECLSAPPQHVWLRYRSTCNDFLRISISAPKNVSRTVKSCPDKHGKILQKARNLTYLIFHFPFALLFCAKLCEWSPDGPEI